MAKHTCEHQEAPSDRIPLQSVSVNTPTKILKKRKIAELDEEITDEPCLNEDERLLGFETTDVLERFWDAARKSLNPNQSDAVKRFVERLSQPMASNEILRDSISGLVERFMLEESELTGLPANELVTYSGEPDAKIGLIMHYPTFLKSNNEVLDGKNPCLKYMMQKVNAFRQDLFAMDLHWRKHKSFERGLCPRSIYSQDVMQLHDEISFTILDKAPLPLLILVGDCVKKQYWKRYKDTIQLSIPLSQGSENASLVVFLNFRDNTLHRIATCISHPANVFRKTAESGSALAKLQDASVNLLLALADITCENTSDAFLTYQQDLKHPERNLANKGYEPLMQLKKLAKEESTSGIVKGLQEYTTELVSWAMALFPNLSLHVLEDREFRGLSIAKLVIDEINTKAAKQRADRRIEQGLPLNSKLAPAKRPTGPKKIGIGNFSDKGPFNYWHGRRCMVPKNGRITLWVPDGKNSRKIQFSAVGEYQKADVDCFIHFEVNGISLKTKEGKDMWTRSISQFKSLGGGSIDLLAQHSMELKRLADNQEI